MRDSVEVLETALYGCSTLPVANGSESLIELLQGLGGQFLDVATKKPHPQPQREVDRNGNILASLYVEHDKLQPDALTLDAIQRKQLPSNSKGRGGLTFIQDQKAVHIGQTIWSSERTYVDQMALSLLSLSIFLYPHFRPQYGWIDELGENRPSKDGMDQFALQHLYWSNLFGPAFVKSLGLDFFSGLPGWRTVDMDDGGVLYIATESYLEWWQNDQSRLLKGFRRKFPGIKMYRAEIHT